MSRYGRTSARREYRDEPEDFRAHIELTDIPSSLTEDPATCARFILHYFINVTHGAVEDVRLLSPTPTDDEVVPAPARPLEAGEIARPVYRMTLGSRDAWDRLRRGSDPPATRRGGFEEPTDTTVIWQHEINDKHVPKWGEMYKVQGGGTVKSLRDRLYARKLKFRLVRVDVNDELPATAFLRQENGTKRSTSDRSRREAQAERSDGDSPIPYSPPRDDGPVLYAPFGSPKTNRPASWDVDPSAAEAIASARATAHRVEERRPEHLLTENYVGHETHTPLTDPWHDREWDRRKSLAEENVKWLERHRAYLLQTQMQHVLPQTRPGFPEGRTIVVWSLAKFMTRKHLALFFSQFGRVDDIKIRLIPDGWSPAGRIAYIAFMSTKDCNDILKLIHGINFPKNVQELRSTKKYWKEYDDFNGFAAQYLLVAPAQKDKWSPISVELVDGKLPPGAKSTYKWTPRTAMGAPPGPRGNRTGDALDYSGYDALPPPPSPPRASRPAAVESRPRSRERRPRSRSASRPRVDLKITLPVMFPDSVVNGEERSQPGEARGEAHKQLKVLALPPGLTEKEFRTLLSRFGFPERIGLAVTPDAAAEVLFNTANALQRAFESAQRTKTSGKFASCHELSVPLGDLDPARQEIFSKWHWNDENDERRPVSDGRQPRAVDEDRPTTDTVEMVPTTTNGKNTKPDSSKAMATMDEVDAYLDSGILPSAKKDPPRPSYTDPRPSDPSATSARPPPRTSANAIPVASTRPTPQETSTSARPSMSSSSQPAPKSLKRAKPSSKLAFLMSQQPEPPEDESIGSPVTEEAGSAKKRRFE